MLTAESGAFDLFEEDELEEKILLNNDLNENALPFSAASCAKEAQGLIQLTIKIIKIFLVTCFTSLLNTRMVPCKYLLISICYESKITLKEKKIS